MNPQKQLRHFLEKAATDKQVKTTHLTVYMALFQLWSDNNCRNPISIARTDIMQLSKINSTATYHKCIRELNAFGYIKYHPSFHPFKGSQVLIISFAQQTSAITD